MHPDKAANKSNEQCTDSAEDNGNSVLIEGAVAPLFRLPEGMPHASRSAMPPGP
jgi:hypothetical protein